MRKYLFYAGMVGLISAFTSFQNCHADLIQWSGNGHWYEVVNSGPISWTSANDTAVAKGGYLACITSSAENDFIYSIAATDDTLWYSRWNGYGSGPWLGGYQPSGSTEPDGGWSWVSGEQWNYANWLVGEPNNSTGPTGLSAQYLHFLSQSSKGSTWDDMYNSEPVRGYVVEYNSVPESSTFVLLGLGGIGLVVFAGRKTNFHSIFGRTSAVRFLLLFTVFSVSFFSTNRLAHAQTVYDASAQFDLNNNPAIDGFWSYGYTPTLGGYFSLLTHKSNDSRMAGWDLPDNEWPDVQKNITGHDLNYPPIGGFVPANGLTMAPGKIGTYTDGYYSALRWTAPSEGSYLIDTTFTGFWDTSDSLGDVHVLVNGVSVFDSTIFRHGSTAYKHSLELNLGDEVDFTLGRNNNTEVRSVINATITAVPEPSAIVLLALSGIGLMAYTRKKRRR